MKSSKYVLSLLLTIFVGCGKEEFSAIKNQEIFRPIDRVHFSDHRCSNFTLVKPKVDFLFLWDNSTSTFSIDEEVKKGVNNLIKKVSGDFDFRIMMAPLLGSGNSNARYLANGPIADGINGMSKIDDLNTAVDALSFTPMVGSTEAGISRAVEILRSNRNALFRRDSYIIVVLMSNEDDDSWKDELDSYQTGDLNCAGIENCPSCVDTSSIESCTTIGVTTSRNCVDKSIRRSTDNAGCKRLSEYTRCNCGKLRGLKNDRNALGLRFITLTTGRGKLYREFSTKVRFGDNHRIDTDTYGNAFDEINSSIKKVLIKHKYNFWPVAGPGVAQIDANDITVKKSSGGTINQCADALSCTNTDGFVYVGNTTANTRYEPSSGEPFTGHLIELYGSARVTYPDCLVVKTKTPKEYFAYVSLGAKPIVSSILITINGVSISESATNGWKLIVDSGGEPEYFERKNIQIVGPGDRTPKNPGVFKSGYFLELTGSAVYTNGAEVKVNYLPRVN